MTSQYTNCPIVPAFLVGIGLTHISILGWLAAWTSPTLNEPAHLAAGIHHWETGSFAMYPVNPPLAKSVAVLPVLLCDYKTDWPGYTTAVGVRSEFEVGEYFVSVNGRQSVWLLTLARWMCIPFSVLGLGICYLWARDLFGPAAGIMACSLWCFSPMVLGNACLITADAHATSLGLAACYTFWRWLQKPTWFQTVVTGGVLGLAELAKTTMVLFYPLWLLIWLVYRWRQRHAMTARNWSREAGMLVLRMAIGIYILNLGYLFEGSFARLGDYQFVSELFSGNKDQPGNRFENTRLAEVPVPFPAYYIIGLDLQQHDFEDFHHPSYLRGEFQDTGWWYYYLYAVLVKAPLGTFGLLVLSVLIRLTGLRPEISARDTLVLLAPAIVIFTVVSSKTGFSHHSRYILPCVPFVFIWMSQLGQPIAAVFCRIRAAFLRIPADQHYHGRSAIGVGLVAIILLTWSLGSSLVVFPHSLSYFNELAGGPENGPEHLINSNVDWGQDLFRLESWIDEQADEQPVHLAFYNFYNPFDVEVEGIAPWPFRADGDAGIGKIPPGLYAISVNLLYEYQWPVRDYDGSQYYIDQRPLAYLRSLEPIGRAGYSIRVFSQKQLIEAYEKVASLTPLSVAE